LEHDTRVPGCSWHTKPYNPDVLQSCLPGAFLLRRLSFSSRIRLPLNVLQKSTRDPQNDLIYQRLLAYDSRGADVFDADLIGSEDGSIKRQLLTIQDDLIDAYENGPEELDSFLKSWNALKDRLLTGASTNSLSMETLQLSRGVADKIAAIATALLSLNALKTDILGREFDAEETEVDAEETEVDAEEITRKSPPYISVPMHLLFPPQQVYSLPPQNHPTSPQSPYRNQPPHSPTIPVTPSREHHSRRESMSSVTMGQALELHLDGSGTMDGSRSPPSAFRDMVDGGFGSGMRRGRGGHSSRGSWTGGGSFGRAIRTPCAFFPAGKCKNGYVSVHFFVLSCIELIIGCSDQCRFPHIMPADVNVSVSPAPPPGEYPGSFGRVGSGSRRPTILGPTLDDKMADLSVKEVRFRELDNSKYSLLSC
jgi:Mating-type protein beta 1